MIRRFSALLSSAAFVKLKDPVITVSASMIITLLCAMECWASLFTGIPTLKRKVADE
jgi:hypothetical protein